MTEITAPIPQGHNKAGISLGKGIAIILLSAVIFAAIGIGVGKAFFWNKYSQETKLDHDLKLNLENVNRDPQNPVAHLNLGVSYLAKGENERAAAEFKKTLSLDPQNYAANYYMGLNYMRQGQYDKAVGSLKEAITITATTSGAHLNLGVSYFYTNKFEDALKELDLAQKYNPGSPETRYWAGMVYEKQNKLDDALAQYVDALRFDPKYQTAIDARERVQKALNK